VVRGPFTTPKADSTIRLGIDRIGPFGHLRCDTRGTAMACVGSFPNKKNAADFHVSEQTPYLWIFELPK
jgi:bifunctional N-acetylglucosamine-1-phosphate-uridyltransferase/glucosamine-1-phosphate-acetyltransferase GlmU-like protein